MGHRRCCQTGCILFSSSADPLGNIPGWTPGTPSECRVVEGDWSIPPSTSVRPIFEIPPGGKMVCDQPLDLVPTLTPTGRAVSLMAVDSYTKLRSNAAVDPWPQNRDVRLQLCTDADGNGGIYQRIVTDTDGWVRRTVHAADGTLIGTCRPSQVAGPGDDATVMLCMKLAVAIDPWTDNVIVTDLANTSTTGADVAAFHRWGAQFVVPAGIDLTGRHFAVSVDESTTLTQEVRDIVGRRVIDSDPNPDPAGYPGCGIATRCHGTQHNWCQGPIPSAVEAVGGVWDLPLFPPGPIELARDLDQPIADRQRNMSASGYEHTLDPPSWRLVNEDNLVAEVSYRCGWPGPWGFRDPSDCSPCRLYLSLYRIEEWGYSGLCTYVGTDVDLTQPCHLWDGVELVRPVPNNLPRYAYVTAIP